ncbi:MAG: hypothetical protein OXC03_01405 [Flavobacteriaceae bacterium]|nr:hypothetical protein [Flavobacteriaceae bacterium]
MTCLTGSIIFIGHYRVDIVSNSNSNQPHFFCKDWKEGKTEINRPVSFVDENKDKGKEK